MNSTEIEMLALVKLKGRRQVSKVYGMDAIR